MSPLIHHCDTLRVSLPKAHSTMTQSAPGKRRPCKTRGPAGECAELCGQRAVDFSDKTWKTSQCYCRENKGLSSKSVNRFHRRTHRAPNNPPFVVLTPEEGWRGAALQDVTQTRQCPLSCPAREWVAVATHQSPQFHFAQNELQPRTVFSV